MTGLHVLLISLGVAIPSMVAIVWYAFRYEKVCRAHYAIGEVVPSDWEYSDNILEKFHQKNIDLSPTEFEKFMHKMVSLKRVDVCPIETHHGPNSKPYKWYRLRQLSGPPTYEHISRYESK